MRAVSAPSPVAPVYEKLYPLGKQKLSVSLKLVSSKMALRHARLLLRQTAPADRSSGRGGFGTTCETQHRPDRYPLLMMPQATAAYGPRAVKLHLSAGKLVLHWGVEGGQGYEGGWRLPTDSCRPEGTMVYKNRALQTPWRSGHDPHAREPTWPPSGCSHLCQSRL